MNTELIPKNKPYDEEVWFEETTSEDLEIASGDERVQDDAYDAAFTNLMVEQFPHLTNPNYISSPDSDTKKCDVFTFRPPTPPKNTSETSLDSLDRSSDINCSNIGNGKFEYISNHNDREMFINAWQAISQTNLWDFVREPIDSFTWSYDQCVEVISEKMLELGYDGHSGISFGSTMRNMQQLAKHGEKKFKELFNASDNSEEVEEEDIDRELDPFPEEDSMEYEQRLKQLIKRRKDK
jgi:hypothetical protein